MTTVQSWAVLLLALSLPVAIIRILWLLAHPFKTCRWCDLGYRGKDHHVLDGWYRPTFGCCSEQCADAAAEAAWYRSQQP